MPKFDNSVAARALALRLIDIGQVARERLLATLTFRERQVVLLRTSLGGGFPYTLEGVGRIFKVTCASVRAVERRAMAKLAAMLDEEEQYHGLQVNGPSW